MFGRLDRLIFTAALLGLTVLVVQSMPDIKRYLQIRNMGDSRQYTRGQREQAR